MEVTRYAREAREVFLIGHAGHPEVEGTIGQFDASYGGSDLSDSDGRGCAARAGAKRRHLAFVTQTTLSVDDTASIVAALRARFPGLKAPVKEDICYATQNRQDAVKDLIGRCEVLVVVGSKSSSNSNRLREMADKVGKPGYLVDGPEICTGVVRRHQDRGGHGRRLGARDFGAGRDYAAAANGAGKWPRSSRGGKEHVIFALPKTCARSQSGSAAFRRWFPRVRMHAPFGYRAAIAQLVEQRIRNAWVRGSNPLCGTRPDAMG
jgi:4-hydroxy-3-methylbut-2-enyl diphosphate reductase